MGCGIYADSNEAFASLKKLDTIYPEAQPANEYQEAYARWKNTLEETIK